LNFNKTRGSHSLKFGAQLRVERANKSAPMNTSTGEFDFGTTWTQGPLDNSPASPIGQGLASMLLGLPSGGHVDRNASYDEQGTTWSLYLHDDWKVTSKLSLNLGLRYEIEGPLTERYNRSLRGFDPNAQLPIAAQVQANYAQNPTPEAPASQFLVRGGLLFAGVGGQPRTLWERDANNLMPRFGLAYRISPKMVVRGGYGIFFGFLGQRRGNVKQTGFSQATNLVPSLDNGLTFAATLANPYPTGIQEPLGAALGPMTYVGQSISFFNSHPLAPYNQRWQFGIQSELPHRVVLDASYVGNRGTHLATSRNLDAFPNRYLSTSPVRDVTTINYWSANVPNPFYPLLPGTSLSSTTVARSQLIVPYPQFTGASVDTNEGYSWYHSLQVKVERRFANGFTVQGAYTWSKFMQAVSFLNPGDAKPERVISDQDFPHHVGISGIYELPFGKGRKWLARQPALLAAMIGGWQVQGFYIGQSGSALGFGNAIFSGNLVDVPLPKDQRTVGQWFNVNAGFNRNSAQQLSRNLITFSSRFSGVRSDGMNTMNLSAIKETAVHERFRVQFRAEAFNALNHPMFAAPNTSLTSSSFGTITSQNGYPRRIQLSLKLVY
jgi:hypothetical protein